MAIWSYWSIGDGGGGSGNVPIAEVRRVSNMTGGGFSNALTTMVSCLKGSTLRGVAVPCRGYCPNLLAVQRDDCWIPLPGMPIYYPQITFTWSSSSIEDLAGSSNREGSLLQTFSRTKTCKETWTKGISKVTPIFKLVWWSRQQPKLWWMTIEGLKNRYMSMW